MQYELARLESIFAEGFANREKDTMQDMQQHCAKAFEKEVKRIESAFLEVLFSTASDAMRRRYIRHHQERLQCMEIKLQHYMQSNRIWLDNAGATGTYMALQQGTSQLLQVIETHFPADMMTESIAPKYLQERVTEEVASALPEVEDKLEQLGTDSRLKELVTDSFERFVARSGYRLSCYGQLYMMRGIGSAVLRHSPAAGNVQPGAPDRWLIELLCHHNFNRLAFYKYCREWITRYFSGESDRLYLYTRCGKFFSRLPVLSSQGWHLQRMTITAMLTDYFKDKYLSEKRRLQQEALFSSGIGGVPAERLAVQLTAEQLGLFIRLLNESGALKSRSSASVIRFFARHVSTAGKALTQEISYDHLKNSYIKSPLPVIEKVDDLLQEMGMQLRKVRMEARRSAKQ